MYKKGQSQEWKIRNVYSNKKYQTLVYKPQKAKKKKVNHANDRVIYLGMEMSRAEAERTKKFCDDAAYTAKEAVTAGTVAIGAAAIYSSGLGEVLTVAGAVIATTSTIAHGANVQEQVSGNNFLKDLVFDGDQKSYEKFQMGLALAEGAVAAVSASLVNKSKMSGAVVRGRKNNNNNPLEKIKYTNKVKKQMEFGDYHSFPQSIDAFGGSGKVSKIVGKNKVIRTRVEISGSYRGKKGIFEYIIEPDGVTCNHRLFKPKE